MYSRNILSALFLLARCRGPEAAVGSQSDPVPRKPFSVGQRPGGIPQPQPDSTRDWAHAQQPPSRSVPLGLGFVLKQNWRNKTPHMWRNPDKLSALVSHPLCLSLSPDYPYCLTGKELKGIIKGLIGRCSDILPDLFDHCVYTMLRELDRQSGTVRLELTQKIERRCGQKRCRHVILNHPVSTKRTILKSIWWSDICKRQLKKTNRQKTQRPPPPFCLQENLYMATEFAFRQSSRTNPKSLPKTCQRWVRLCPDQITASLRLSALSVQLLSASFLRNGQTCSFSSCFQCFKSRNWSLCPVLSVLLVFGITAVCSESSSQVSDHHVGSWSSWILWPQPGTTR